MRAYTARVSREGKWWMISVPDIDGLTQARRLGEVEDMARSLIAITADIPPDSFDVDVQIEAVEDLRITEIKNELESSRAEMEQAQSDYRARLRDGARRLHKQGVTVRDIGYILGVSFQRAQQVLDESVVSAQHAPTADYGDH